MAKMTVEGCINAAVRLLNQYSIAGTLVPLSYNDQADDIARMVDLINDAQMEIATVARPVYADIEFVVPEISPNAPLADVSVEMPDDFNHPTSVTFTPLKGYDRRTIDAPEYKWIGNDIILVPNKPAGTYRVEYNRWPVRYATNIIEMTDPERAALMATELDNTPDTHEIIPYFVAAMVALDDNPKAYSALYNVWETRLSRLNIKPPHAERTIIEDVYGFGDFHGVW